jgi:hypothetical protein
LPEAITRAKDFLTMLGVEGEETALQAECLDQFRRGRYFVAFLFDHQMSEHDLISLTQRRQHVRGLAVAKGVETAAQGLTVDGDRCQPLGRWRRFDRGGVAAKRFLQSRWIDPLQNQPQARIGWRIAQAQIEGFVQAPAMYANEFMQLPIRIGAGDHAQDRVEQHCRQFKPLPFPPPMIGNRAQNLQKRHRHPTTSDSGCRL